MNEQPDNFRCIVWLDSNAVNGWHDKENVDYGAVKVTTIGWLVHEDEESVTLSGSVIFGKDHLVTDTMTVPKCCIVEDKTVFLVTSQ